MGLVSSNSYCVIAGGIRGFLETCHNRKMMLNRKAWRCRVIGAPGTGRVQPRASSVYRAMMFTAAAAAGWQLCAVVGAQYGGDQRNAEENQ